MRLFTFQNPLVRRSLTTHGNHVSRIASRANAFMAAAMEKRGIHLGAAAPVWAWYAGTNSVGPSVKHETGRALLSDHEISQGIEVLELSVPKRQVLLSRYDVWNLILEDYLAEGHDVPSSLLRDLFDIDCGGKWEPLQACIPCIKGRWLRGVEPFVCESHG